MFVLKIRHRYEITFTFNCPNCIEGSLVVRNQEPPNLYVHVVDLRALDFGNTPHSGIPNDPGTSSSVGDPKNQQTKYKIIIEFFAHKEKLLKEQISLQSSQNPLQTISMVFHARVLGKGKGTPYLKDGVKCIGVEMDEDDEGSDWQGFN